MCHNILEKHVIEPTWDSIHVLPRTMLFIAILVTIIGNILVLIAMYFNKRLQRKFKYYIFNLAVTNVAVGVTKMFPYDG